MADEEEKIGFFEWALTGLGFISGAVFGYDVEGWIGAIILAFVGGAIGKAVGALADWTVKLMVAIVFLLINSFTRQLIWEFVRSIFGI